MTQDNNPRSILDSLKDLEVTNEMIEEALAKGRAEAEAFQATVRGGIILDQFPRGPVIPTSMGLSQADIHALVMALRPVIREEILAALDLYIPIEGGFSQICDDEQV